MCLMEIARQEPATALELTVDSAIRRSRALTPKFEALCATATDTRARSARLRAESARLRHRRAQAANGSDGA